MNSKSNHTTASSHCIAKEKINPDIVLEQQCWYHGSIGRIEAEELLQPEKDGTFLVRMSESSKLDYSLSLKSGRGFLHMKIVNLDGKFILGQFSQPFDSIPDMVEFYCMSKLPIKGSENISLIHPLANECSL